MQRWHQLLEEEQEWALLEVSQDADDPSVWAQVPERARERFFVEFPEPEPEARVEDDAMMSPALGGDRVEGVLEGNDGEDVQVPSVPSAQEDALLLLGLSEPHNNEADSDDELPDLEQPSPAIDTPAILPPPLCVKSFATTRATVPRRMLRILRIRSTSLPRSARPPSPRPSPRRPRPRLLRRG